MARSLNKVMLIGNVGNEPEIRTTASGKRVAKLSLATSWGTGDKEKTNWHRITAWERIAEIIEQYVHKGDRVYVEGSIEYSTTEDENGKPRYWTDIVVRELLMLSSPSGNGEEDEPPPRRKARAPARSAAPTPFDDDDDLPF